MSALVTIFADTHLRPERHTHRGLRDDSIPMMHVEPMDTRLRQLRVVLQELEQDDVEVVALRPECSLLRRIESTIHGACGSSPGSQHDNGRHVRETPAVVVVVVVVVVGRGVVESWSRGGVVEESWRSRGGVVEESWRSRGGVVAELWWSCGGVVVELWWSCCCVVVVLWCCCGVVVVVWLFLVCFLVWFLVWLWSWSWSWLLPVDVGTKLMMRLRSTENNNYWCLQNKGKGRFQLAPFLLENVVFLNFQCVKGTFFRCYDVFFCVFEAHDFHHLFLFSRLSHLRLLFTSSPLPLLSLVVSVVVVFSVLCCRRFLCLVLSSFSLFCVVAAVAAGCCCCRRCLWSCVFLSDCCSFLGKCSLFLLIFSVTQAVAE